MSLLHQSYTLPSNTALPPALSSLFLVLFALYFMSSQRHIRYTYSLTMTGVP